MSLNSLTNAAAARRTDMHPIGVVPQGFSAIAMASRTPPSTSLPLTQVPEGQGATEVNTAMNVLFGYIPTEIVTLYVAFLTALQKGVEQLGKGPAPPVEASILGTSGWIAFWAFLVATPAVVWVLFATKVKAAATPGQPMPLPLHPRAWPCWEMFAATIGFVAWAFALPTTPFEGFSWYSPALAAIGVLIASTILGLLAPLFQRPLSA